jgi:Transposase, Mutator family
MHPGHHRATPEGKKELLGFVDGARESAHDWRALLLDLKRRGLSMAPKIAVADGALGFWKAIGIPILPSIQLRSCAAFEGPLQLAPDGKTHKSMTWIKLSRI